MSTDKKESGNKEVYSIGEGYAKQTIQLVYDDLREVAHALKAVNHTLRRGILDMITTAREMNVTDIYVRLKLDQSVASQHLAVLRKAGLVHCLRRGKCVYYSVDAARIKQMNDLCRKLAK